MIQRDDIEKLTEIAETASRNNDCILYDLVVSQHARNRRLQVFIDRPGGEGESVSLKDCENVSRALSLLLDVEDIVQGGAYDLEVSTPGLERALTKDWHFEQALGRTVRLKTKAFVSSDVNPKAKVKSIVGQLKEFSPSHITIENEKGKWLIEKENLNKIQVQFSMEKQLKRNKPQKRNK